MAEPKPKRDAGFVCYGVATFLFFVATLLLALSCVSAPIVHNISILQVDVDRSVDGSEAGSKRSVTFGAFGWCELDVNGNGIDLCSAASLGYSPAAILSDNQTNINNIPLNDKNANNKNPIFFTPYATTTSETLTHALLLHPLSAGLSFLSFCLTLWAGTSRFKPITLPLVNNTDGNQSQSQAQAQAEAEAAPPGPTTGDRVLGIVSLATSAVALLAALVGCALDFVLFSLVTTSVWDRDVYGEQKGMRSLSSPMSQAMTSSVLDGVAVCDSPAPPAFSPLTEPTTPGNREPDLDDVSPLVADNHAVPEKPDPMDLDHVGHGAAAVARLQTPTPTPTPSAQQPALTPHDIARSVLQDADNPAGISIPQTTDPTTPAHATTTAAGAAVPGVSDVNFAPMGIAESPNFNTYAPSPSQLLMALARISAAQPVPMITRPPDTVQPSQVSLTPQALLNNPGGLANDSHDAPGAANHPPVDAPLESFARIEFADSVFQMTTYAVIIGRDQRALEQARRDERRMEEYQRKVREAQELGLPPPPPPTQDRGKFSKSYVSEEGGMLGPESDGDENPRPAKRRKMSAAGSVSGDSRALDGETPGEAGVPEEKNVGLNRQYVSHTPGAAAVNLSALRPSPYYVPFIGIHSPGPNIASRTKAISREHLKIEFNQKTGVFEAIPLHKNGFFCEDVHYRDQKVVLRSGDRLQIKDVDFVFIINGVPRGKTGAEDLDEEGHRPAAGRRYSEGGKEMSFEFESSHDPERRSTSPEETPAAPAKESKEDSDSELSPVEDIPEPPSLKAPEQQEIRESIEKDPETPAPTTEQSAAQPSIKTEMSLEMLATMDPPLPKKRGPGRPPKNGIMSKREERARKKAAMELAKKNMPQPPPGEPPVKRKVGRPRKHPLPEDGGDRPEKRKYKPRKPKGEDGEGGSDVEKTVKERRREKPKTPPLELRREDYTEEQLQKPPKNYGMLIDEVLSAAPEGLTLKQIYKRIQMKYPFYYFTVDTKGWESSVRHNLIGNDAFRKNEETHLWSRVPGIDIDAGKKRTKATSPDNPANANNANTNNYGQQHYASATPGSQIFHNETGVQHGYRSGSAPQRTQFQPVQGQAVMGQHGQPHPGQQAAGTAAQGGPRPTYVPAGQAPGAAPAAAYGNAAGAPPAQGNMQGGAYSSPYMSRPLQGTAGQPAGGVAQQGAARPGHAPGHAPNAANGFVRPGTQVPGQAGAPGGPRPAQPAANVNTLPLKPAVAPEMVKHVTNFVKTVTEQLSKRTPNAVAVAMSVVNRGLGLASESTVPNEETLEKIVLGVFESSTKNLSANYALHPDLVQSLRSFQNNMIKTLEPKMGRLDALRLILSAVDRVLGFAEQSTMPGADKKQYDEAENVLISAIRQVVLNHQRSQAAAAAAAAQRAAKPGAPPSAPGTPGVVAAQGQAPPPNYAAMSTAPGARPAVPAAPQPANPGPAVARPPMPAQPTMAAKPGMPAAPGQAQPQPQRPAVPVPQAGPVRPQAPSTAAQPAPQLPPSHFSAPANTVTTQGVAQPRVPAAPAPGAQQAAAAAPVATQPQTPAHALAQAKAQAAANAQMQASGVSTAAATSQTPGQPVPPPPPVATPIPKPPAPAQPTGPSQPAPSQATQFAKPQAPAQGLVSGPAPNPVQGAGAVPSPQLAQETAAAKPPVQTPAVPAANPVPPTATHVAAAQATTQASALLANPSAAPTAPVPSVQAPSPQPPPAQVPPVSAAAPENKTAPAPSQTAAPAASQPPAAAPTTEGCITDPGVRSCPSHRTSSCNSGSIGSIGIDDSSTPVRGSTGSNTGSDDSSSASASTSLPVCSCTSSCASDGERGAVISHLGR
ncbi:hypothetical protein VTJ04DRAFT_9992 [Mycothermus thermophilus]|uniref:uncharacterized protein n=1 Tax=Humicola insolens TaxID=85995 RepID=UPI003743A5E6